MRDRLKSLSKEVARKVKAAPLNEAYAIMEDSKENYVPVDKGDLKDSGKVTPNVRGNNISIALTYGDEKTNDYAAAIHEHPSEASPPSWKGVEVNFHPSGRGPKYLEKPLKNAVKGMAERLAEDMKLE